MPPFNRDGCKFEAYLLSRNFELKASGCYWGVVVRVLTASPCQPGVLVRGGLARAFVHFYLRAELVPLAPLVHLIQRSWCFEQVKTNLHGIVKCFFCSRRGRVSKYCCSSLSHIPWKHVNLSRK